MIGPERTTYAFGTTRVTVVAGNGDTARWLAEFVTPWFPVVRPGDDGVLVRMITSAPQVEHLTVRQANADTHPVPGFRLDRGVAPLPAWTEADGSTVAADAAWRCFYRVRPGAVDVIAAPGDYLPRVGLMRVVRELLILGATPRPAVLDLHAAAFVHQGSVVLLAGARRRGKTTLLAHALSSGETALMANDRVIVDVASGTAEGVPTVVSVREGTEQLFSALGRGVPRRATLLHADETSRPDACAAAVGSRLVLSPAQLAGQLGAGVEPRAPLGTIVFPEIRDDEPRWSLQRLAVDDARRRLSEAVYAGGVNAYERTVFHRALAAPADQPATATEDERQHMIARLAAAVPMVQMRMGPDVYLDDARAWLRALPQVKRGAHA